MGLPINISDKRRGSATVWANDKEERLLMQMSNRIPFDDRMNHFATVTDLNPTLIRSFLKDIKSDLHADVDKIPLSDLARQMRIASGADEYLLPINVGLLFFTAHPEIFFRGANQSSTGLYFDSGAREENH